MKWESGSPEVPFWSRVSLQLFATPNQMGLSVCPPISSHIADATACVVSSAPHASAPHLVGKHGIARQIGSLSQFRKAYTILALIPPLSQKNRTRVSEVVYEPALFRHS
jgi:hypothetical protein